MKARNNSLLKRQLIVAKQDKNNKFEKRALVKVLHEFMCKYYVKLLSIFYAAAEF